MVFGASRGTARGWSARWAGRPAWVEAAAGSASAPGRRPTRAAGPRSAPKGTASATAHARSDGSRQVLAEVGTQQRLLELARRARELGERGGRAAAGVGVPLAELGHHDRLEEVGLP